jgi:N,N'-diacetyllegionaminate synthase
MKPVIIAECCQNHNGSKEILKRMIHEAAENGADFVKIQAIRSRELTHRPQFDEGENNPDGTIKTIKRPYPPELERLSGLDLSIETEAWFVEECWRAGISPMTTVFTKASLNEVKEMGYEAIKIASYDCGSVPLLKMVKQYWKKVFVSTGATFDEEIKAASDALSDCDLHLLHCVTIYPTPLNILNLRRMSYLRKFATKVGFSDHSHVEQTGLRASMAALALGADVIERHFTVLNSSETKDGPVSINPAQLRELSHFASLERVDRMEILSREFKDWAQTLGVAQRELTSEELLNRDYYRGRLASVKNGLYDFNWEE